MLPGPKIFLNIWQHIEMISVIGYVKLLAETAPLKHQNALPAGVHPLKNGCSKEYLFQIP